MIKVIVRIFFICITSISLNLLYQVFFTRERFDGSPILFFPHLNHPTFVIITFIIGFIFEKYILKSKTVRALAFALLVTLAFIFIAKFIEIKYGYIYEHYYKNHPYENLTHLKEYSETRDNYITLGKALRDEGIKIKNIQGGFTEKGHINNPPEAFQKKLYFINKDIYIIFDWNEKMITAQAEKEELLESLYDIFNNINEDMHSDALYSHYRIGLSNEKNKLLKNYRIEPTEEGTFKFTETR